MIKFFRKIRYDLMEENKVGKYLMYAVGELILVVVGILLALQISDWSEDHKKAEQRTVLIKALKAELQSDVEKLQSYLRTVDSDLVTNSSYVTRLAAAASVDTLVQITRYEYTMALSGLTELSKTTFNSLESTGRLDLLGAELAKTV
jgi:hypothetical protein